MKKKPTLAVLFGGNSPGVFRVPPVGLRGADQPRRREVPHPPPGHHPDRPLVPLFRGLRTHRHRHLGRGVGPPHPCGGLPGPGGSRAAGPLPPREPGDSPGLRPAHSPRGQRGGRHRPGPLPAGGDPRGRLRHPGLRPVHGQGPGPQAGQAGRGGRPPAPWCSRPGRTPSGPRTSPSRRGIPCSSSR